LLAEAEFAINNITNKSTGYTPSRLLFGIDQRGPNIDGIKEYIEEKDTSIEHDLESIREEAGKNILRVKNVINIISISVGRDHINIRKVIMSESETSIVLLELRESSFPRSKDPMKSPRC